jgi:hypothetical protein
MVEISKERHVGQEEALAKTLLKLTEVPPEDLVKTITQVREDEELFYLSALYTWAKETNMSTLKDFCDNFLLLRISSERQGRKELALTVALAGSGGLSIRPKSFKDVFSGLRL